MYKMQGPGGEECKRREEKKSKKKRREEKKKRRTFFFLGLGGGLRGAAVTDFSFLFFRGYVTRICTCRRREGKEGRRGKGE